MSTTPTFLDPPAVLEAHFGEQIVGGPTEDHLGDLVIRVLADSVLIARVTGAGPYGNNRHVRLSDGTVRPRATGSWYAYKP